MKGKTGNLLFLLIVGLLFLSNFGFADQHWTEALQNELDLPASINGVHYKCGLPILAEAYAKDPEATRRIMDAYRAERLNKATDTFVSPSGRFIIEYQTSGFDAIPTYDRDNNGTPDYLEFVAKSFDRAWEVEVDSLGFRPPPDQNGQPKSTYSVICRKLSNSLYGSTLFIGTNDIAALPGLNFTSEIEFNTDFSFINSATFNFTTAYPGGNDPIIRDSMAIAVTAAHEFNHALQLGYRFWSSGENTLSDIVDLRYIEGSAVYMEEVVANQVNDYYQYLRSFYRRTDRNWGDSSVLYGDVIFYIMLGNIYGKTITREIWEEIVNQPSLPAMEAVFQRKESSFNFELTRLASWMFFSGANSLPGLLFKEAANYPDPFLAESDDILLNSVTSQTVYEDELPPLSFLLLKIPVVAVAEGISIAVSPANAAIDWGGVNFSFAQPHIQEFPANIFSETFFNSPEDDLFEAVISGNWSDVSDSLMDFEVRLRSSNVLETDEIFAYPNVIKPGLEVAQVTFINLPENAVIEIFTGNGVRVASVEPSRTGKIAFWNLTTFQGKPVGTGVYIYRVQSNTKSKSGKILVVR